ncbi:MAG: transglycosylase SLT domain-containing protein [Alphaproteobacteria bacterium]|nr:MAG: transglycosylase SLT domain-containing protein [Alphaproteobacteria bacterium]
MLLLFANLALWKEMTDPNVTHSFKDIQAFLDKYPRWPREKKVVEKGEVYITTKTPSAKALGWFRKYKPISLQAHAVYIHHLPKHKKAQHIRHIWQTTCMTLDEQMEWYKKYLTYLNRKAHLRRLDFLYVTKQSNMLSAYGLLVSKFKRNAKFRHDCLEKKPRIKLLKTPSRGETLAYLHHLRSKGRFDDIYLILRNFKHDQNTFAQQWAYERLRLAKELVQKKRPREAYEILDKGPLRGSHLQNDVVIFKIEIGYHLLGYRKKLVKPLQYIYARSGNPSSKSYAAYYLGMIQNDTEWFKKATSYPTTYFGQKALKRLKLKSPPFMIATKFTKQTDLIKALFALDTSDPEVLKEFIFAVMRRDVNTLDQAAAFIEKVDQKFGPPFTLWAGLYAQMRFSKTPKLKCLYPTLPGVKSPFYLGIIKQESLFDPRARSCANALGYMQLIRKTACKYAGYAATEEEILDPKNNLEWGGRYICALKDIYNHSVVLMLCDYNAGDFNVKKWVDIYGDPKKISEEKFIALIPFKETKHYVKQVLANQEVYKELM